jgi:hypothetical protein
LVNTILIDALGNILHVVTHHQRGDACSDLNILDPSPDLSASLIDDLAVLLDNDLSELLKSFLHEIFQPEHIPGTGEGCGLAPFFKGGMCSFYYLVGFISGGKGNLSDDLSRGGVYHIQYIFRD